MKIPDLARLSVGIFVTLIAIIGGTFGIWQFIDWRIDQVVKSDDYIEDIALKVRPFLIFDAEETIHDDKGAGEYITNISVILDSSKNYPKKILINPKKHLPNAPIIEALGSEIVDFYSKRGKGNQWQFDVDLTASLDSIKNPPKFRLEIIK